ncbi:MAG: heavy-metal-associated domain-containing protein [Candidatus Micrarchaeota archaeon]
MKATFKVPKMHCDSCNWLISENVKEVEGVTSVKADYTKHEVSVEYGRPADEGKIIEAIQKEGGYKVV